MTLRIARVAVIAGALLACESTSDGEASPAVVARPLATELAADVNVDTTPPSTVTAPADVGAPRLPSATTTCAASELRVLAASRSAGLGNRSMYFDVAHDGPSACAIEGVADITLLDRAHAPLKSPIVRSDGTYFTASAPVTHVTVPAKGRAHFELAYRAAAATCPTSKTLRVKIGVATFTVPAAIQACDTDPIVVTPFRAGASPPGM